MKEKHIGKLLLLFAFLWVYFSCFWFFVKLYKLMHVEWKKILEKILPGLTRCPFLTITGKPCPLCGGTRFIEGMPNVFKDITYIFNFFGIVMIVILLEFIFRIINLCKKEHSNKLMNIDIIIHIILVCAFFLYEIIYIIKIM